MRLHRWIVALASRLVPERRPRLARRMGRRAPASRGRARGAARGARAARESSGAFWDAWWLQSSRGIAPALRPPLAPRPRGGVLPQHRDCGDGHGPFGLQRAAVSSARRRRSRNASIHPRPHRRRTVWCASFPEYAAYRDQTRAFSDIAAFPCAISSLPLASGDLKAQVVTTQVSDNFFSVLGITPAWARFAFRTSPANDADDIVIGDALWRKLGANAAVLGMVVRSSEPSGANHRRRARDVQRDDLGLRTRRLDVAEDSRESVWSPPPS